MKSHRTSKWERHRTHWLLLAILVMGCRMRMYGQTPGDSDGDSPKIQSATALGDIFFKSRNSLIFALGADATAQDNVLFTDADQKTFDTTAALFGRIAYQRQYQKTSFGLDYSLGSRIYNRNDQYNQLTHQGGFDLQHRMTERLTFSLNDRIRVAPEFRGLYARDLVLEPAPLNTLPNSSLVLPLNKSIISTTYATISYKWSPRSQLSLGGDYSLGRYDLASLQAQTRYGVNVSYSYRLAERTTLNLSYVYSNFNQSGVQLNPTDPSITPSSKAHRHYPTVGISHQLTPSVSGFVSVGPNVIIGDSIDLITGTRLRPGVYASINAGLTLSKSIALDPRTFFSFGVDQNISDGSGLGLVAQTQTAYVSLGRLLTRKVNVAARAGYARNKFISNFDETGQEVVTNGILAGANLRISLTERLSFHADYHYVRQLSTGFHETIPASLSWNGIVVGLSYSIPIFF
jgi:hypothetical protein